MRTYWNTCYFVTILLVFGIASFLQADCPLAHTHIGINPTWRPADWGPPPTGAVDPNPDDNDKLWFFSLPPIHPAGTPGWPEWGDPQSDPFLLLQPVTDGQDNLISKPGDDSRFLYTCDFLYSKDNGYGDPYGVPHLDGWHSAFGPQGAWNLESVDQQTVPDWDIRLVRVGTSLAEDNFFMLDPDEQPLLTINASEYALTKEWLVDKNGWGIHEHMTFHFWLAEKDSEQTITATFSAYDADGMYEASDPYTFRFRMIPEPLSLSLLALGSLGMVHRRKR